MKAIILCGGIGKRMLPILEEKYFLKFNGKTLLERLVSIVRGLVDEIEIIASPISRERIEKMVPDAKVTVQDEPKGMGDALLKADLEGEVLILNPNDVVEPWIIERIARTKGMAVPGYVVSSYFPGGYLIGDSRMEGVIEKPGPGNEPSNMVKLVIDKIDGDLLRRELEKHKGEDSYEKALHELCKEHEIRIVRYEGKWQAIKYPWDILKVADILFEEMEEGIKSSDVSERAEINGKVLIEEGVKVLSGSVINGPAYIGRNSFIGNHSLIWGGTTLVGRDVVGSHTEIKHSYIMEDTWFHRNYIGDSVIGRNCSFGAGTVLSNFRFDEKTVKVNVNGKAVDTGMVKLGSIIGDNCKTGINVSIMPGRKVGPNSVIGPHTMVQEDVPENTYLKVEQLQIKAENRLEPKPEIRRMLMEKLRHIRK